MLKKLWIVSLTGHSYTKLLIAWFRDVKYERFYNLIYLIDFKYTIMKNAGINILILNQSRGMGALSAHYPFCRNFLLHFSVYFIQNVALLTPP